MFNFCYRFCMPSSNGFLSAPPFEWPSLSSSSKSIGLTWIMPDFFQIIKILLLPFVVTTEFWILHKFVLKNETKHCNSIADEVTKRLTPFLGHLK
jgi:hypothetical protein